MADVSITGANVLRGSDSKIENGVAGATITAGQVVYRDASDSDKFKLADTNSATAAARVPYGVALHTAAAGQPLQVQTSGSITIGGTVVPGTIYCSSATAGGVAPHTDLASGHYTGILGIALSTTVIELMLHAPAVAIP